MENPSREIRRLIEAWNKEGDGSSLSLANADLRRAVMFNANLFKADLRGAKLVEANLRGADLSGADLRPFPFILSSKSGGKRG